MNFAQLNTFPELPMFLIYQEPGYDGKYKLSVPVIGCLQSRPKKWR
jgi:hypothetical protein